LPVLLPTNIFRGVEVLAPYAGPVGVAMTVMGTAPRTEGLHVQVAEKLDPEPDADLFLHPVKIVLPALNVILEATLTFAVITTGVR
jgi:hypothetical protein